MGFGQFRPIPIEGQGKLMHAASHNTADDALGMVLIVRADQLQADNGLFLQVTVTIQGQPHPAGAQIQDFEFPAPRVDGDPAIAAFAREPTSDRAGRNRILFGLISHAIRPAIVLPAG